MREEIIVPILKRLGYTASGSNRIVRSKSLLHPFVMIGTKKHQIHIIPDYLLYSDDRPGLILDAKRPNETLVNSTHTEQAYSYAIHPEVRVEFYALCSGNQLVAYHIHSIYPILNYNLSEIDRNWDTIASVLSPKNVSFAVGTNFQPDFGTAVVKMGTPPGFQWLFACVKCTHLACVHDDLYTMSSTLPIGGVEHCISFDANKKTFHDLLQLTDKENRKHILDLIAPCQSVTPLRPIHLFLDTIVGEPTRGQYEVFVPFIIRNACRLSEEAILGAEALSQIHEKR